MFEKAQASGEAFVDISGKMLRASLDADPGVKGLSRCNRILKGAMIPGDCDLTATCGGSRSTVIIRFRLPR